MQILFLLPYFTDEEAKAQKNAQGHMVQTWGKHTEPIPLFNPTLLQAFSFPVTFPVSKLVTLTNIGLWTMLSEMLPYSV